MSGIAHSTVPTGSTEHWQDKKRYLWLIGLVVPVAGLHRVRRVGGDRVGRLASGSARW